MNLSVGLDIARAGLAATSEQTALVSRNIAGANDPRVARKIANVVSGPDGAPRVTSIRRATDAALAEKTLMDKSAAAAASARLAGLDRLDATVGDTANEASPAAVIAKLEAAVRKFASAPQDGASARAFLEAARSTANTLNTASDTVRTVRQDADTSIADDVERLNKNLARLAELNQTIVGGTRGGADVSDALDTRASVLTDISEMVGIRILARKDNDIAVFTEGGVTMFDASPRAVAFNRTPVLTPGASGNPIFIDGIAVSGGSAGMPLTTGRLQAQAVERDKTTVTYQSQLDEIARGLVVAFAEHDQNATPTLPDQAGLFTYPGGPALPSSAAISPGLAGSLRLNPAADPDRGGTLARLRDGGISAPGNPAYTSNTTGAAGFGDRLNEIITALESPMAFDAKAEGADQTTLAGFASSSVAWLQQARKSASDDDQHRSVALDRSQAALSKATGVSIDEEMTTLLELERSFQASIKLISAIDGMFASLLEATK